MAKGNISIDLKPMETGFGRFIQLAVAGENGGTTTVDGQEKTVSLVGLTTDEAVRLAHLLLHYANMGIHEQYVAQYFGMLGYTPEEIEKALRGIQALKNGLPVGVS